MMSSCALRHEAAAHRRSSWNCSHLVDEAVAFLADAVALGHAHAVEENLRGVRGMHAQLVELARHGDAFRFHRQADQRLVAMRRAVAGVGEQAHPIGLRAVGDPHLAAVDDVVVAVGARIGLDRGDVGSGAGLGNADAGDRIAGDGGREEFAAQRVRAEAGERRGRHVGLHADRHRHAAAADGAELLGHHHRVGIVEPLAAVLRRLGEAEETEPAELLEQFVGGKSLRLLPFVDERIDLGGDEFLQRAARFLVLGREQHGSSPQASNSCPRAAEGLGSSSQSAANPPAPHPASPRKRGEEKNDAAAPLSPRSGERQGEGRGDWPQTSPWPAAAPAHRALCNRFFQRSPGLSSAPST